MTREDIEELLIAMGWVELHNHREGWVTTACPLAAWNHGGGVDNNPSFGIRIGDDPAICVCLSCGFGGTIMDLMTELIIRLPVGTPARKQAVKILHETPVIQLKKGLTMPIKTSTKIIPDPLFPETWLNNFPDADTATPLGYLMGRGLKASDVANMDIRYDAGSGRILFPIRDWSGQLRGGQGRTISNGQPKYLFYKWDGVACGHSVMMGEHLIDNSKPVILVEGVFDYAALFPYTTQVLVLWGSRITPSRLERLSRLTKIYTAFDADEAGAKARQTLLGSPLKVTNLVLPSGVTDVGEADPDTLERLASYVDNYGTLR